MKVISLGLALFLSLCLVGCGGSSGGNKKPPVTPSSSSVPASSSSVPSSEAPVSSSEASASEASSEASSDFSSQPPVSSSAVSSSSEASSSSLAESSSSVQSSAPVTYSLSGSIAGNVEGDSFTLNGAGQTLVIDSNGDFSFPNTVLANTEVTLSLTDVSQRQVCSITSETEFVVTANVDNIVISCTPVGVLTGRVTSYHTGTPIPQARITVTANDDAGELLLTASALTDETGTYRIEGLGISSRFVLNAWSQGFATRSEIFSNTAEQPDVSHSALVLEANYSTGFAASSAASLVVDGLTLVELPANAFVNADGSPATGTITPALTIIDPSGDASVMPGNYEVLNPETGEINLMESFGALDASFRDEEGNLLQLAPGTSATISIPLASRITAGNAPATVPLFYFDEERGYWIEEGEATLTQVGSDYFYLGTVTHFTTWNADRIYETINLNGCVEDAEGNRLANVRVVASGRDYIGSSTGYSDSQGNFVLPVRISSQILVTSISGSQSDTIVVNSQLADLTLDACLQLAESSATITLTWGENPRDLDSHLYIPNEAGTSEFHLYYVNTTQEVNGVIFDLDVDDVSSFGPEVVTIPDFPHAGIYRYIVHHFTGSGNIASSPARVELNLRGQIYVFSPGNAEGENTLKYWHVFNIQVDDQGNATVLPVQQFRANGRVPDAVLGSRLAPAVEKTGAQSRKEYKHYTK
jgi:uncharacterized protein YfaP (DUF2135 family)